MLPNAKLMLDMLRNHKQVIESLLKDYKWSEQQSIMYMNRVKMINVGKTIKPEVMLTAVAETMARLTSIQMKVILLVLVYTAGDNFGGDAARMAMKLGADPKETIREMFKRKMGE